MAQRCLDRLGGGDAGAREELLVCAARRLEHLARKMLRGFPGLSDREQSRDVMQDARLWRSLAAVRPDGPRGFFRLAAAQLRRELRDLARHYFGPAGKIGRASGRQRAGTGRPA